MSILTIKKVKERLPKKDLQRKQFAIHAEVPGQGIELTTS
jgi:hypothetical protein